MSVDLEIGGNAERKLKCPDYILNHFIGPLQRQHALTAAQRVEIVGVQPIECAYSFEPLLWVKLIEALNT